VTTETVSGTLGIVLMSFGSPAKVEDVPAYLASARGGNSVPVQLIAEFQRRYTIIGGSPLLHITQEQASALESLLNAEAEQGERYRVAVGMLHSPPWISDALAQLASQEITQVIAIILSPQYSPIIMSGYHRAVEEARSVLGHDITVQMAGAWHRLPFFLDALAQRAREALDRFPLAERVRVPVIFTAHSLPKRVVDREPGYIEQLRETVEAVAQRVGLASDRWTFAYQSAGHTPQEWLKPDIKDLFPGLREAGHKSVLVVPVQFVTDHLELLYDIDVAALTQAEEAGLSMTRTEAFNLMPEFIRALADLVRRELLLDVEASTVL